MLLNHTLELLLSYYWIARDYRTVRLYVNSGVSRNQQPVRRMGRPTNSFSLQDSSSCCRNRDEITKEDWPVGSNHLPYVNGLALRCRSRHTIHYAHPVLVVINEPQSTERGGQTGAILRMDVAFHITWWCCDIANLTPHNNTTTHDPANACNCELFFAFRGFGLEWGCVDPIHSFAKYNKCVGATLETIQ